MDRAAAGRPHRIASSGRPAALAASSVRALAARPRRGHSCRPRRTVGAAAFVVSNLAAVLVLTLLLSIVTAPMHTMPRLLRILSGETLTIYMFHLIVLFGFNLQLARRIGATQTLPQALALAAGMILLTSAYALAWHHVKARRRAHAG
jgi:surface polysaccharide O-acyltransferase-like enzyme